MVKAAIFDVFGTLVDWRTGVAAAVSEALGARAPGFDAAAFADAWRAEYQPAMEPIRSGVRDYVPLDLLHRENLDRVLARFGLAEALGEKEAAELSRAWERLPPWPDVPEGLEAMRARVFVAPCSNASVALSIRLARHAGFRWDCVLGAEAARAYKPDPAVYRAAVAALGLDPSEVMMVAAHNDDLSAAAALGLRTGFVARPQEYGPGQRGDLGPEGDWDVVAASLPELAARL